MAITKITKAKSINALVSYVQTPKNKDKERVIDSVCYGSTLGTAKQDFKTIRRMYNKDKGYVQGYSMIISWAQDELNPNNPDDVAKAKEVVSQLMNEHYNGHQFVSVLQADGDGGNLHAHVAINAVNTYTGKSLRGEQTRGLSVAKWSDEIQQNMQIKNNNLEREQWQDKQSMASIKIRDKGKYSWVDDIKQRISDCMDNPTIQSVAQFIQSMRDDFNVNVHERNSKKTDTGKMFTYDFLDKMGKKRKIRETKLGNVYGSEGIHYGCAENQKQQQQQQSINNQLQQQLQQQQLQQLIQQQQQYNGYDDNGYDDETANEHQSTANAEQPRDANAQNATESATDRVKRLKDQLQANDEKRLRDAYRDITDYNEQHRRPSRTVSNDKESEWDYGL